MQNVKAHAPEAKANWQAIPLAQRIRNILIGLGSIALALVIHLKFSGLSIWLVYGLLGFGVYSAATDMVRSFFGFLPATIRDVRAAIKGNGK